MATIRVLAIVVGDTTTVFYKEDGSTVELPSNDLRIPGMVAAATPVIAAGLVAEVDFTNVNTYKEVEEKTGGLVKLFRVAKKFVQHIFHDPHTDPVTPQVIGTVPVVTNGQPVHPVEGSDGLAKTPAPEPTPEVKKLTNAASEILSKAQSVSDKNFTTDEHTDEDTMIAVVQNEKGEQVIIPGMEHLQQHFAAALKLGSTTGVENFLRRISKVIDQRGHSIDDLLRFMAKNDMPIADDGCFVAFKTLNRRGNKANEYQDIHSGNVIQRVGSRVFMAEKMVDPNRRNECSNGLHVARRAYVGGFRSGSGVMVLIKVAPEDAIAVPQYDGNKMRVCGYHIVADVPAEDHSTVYSNRPLPKESKTARVLGAILKGQHIGIIEHVEIGGSNGGNLRITRVGGEAENKQQLAQAVEQTKKAEPVASMDDEKSGAATNNIDLKAVAASTAAAKANAGNKQSQARMLFDSRSFAELIQLKKGAKKSWRALGFTQQEEEQILSSEAPVTTSATLGPVPRVDGEPAPVSTKPSKTELSKTVVEATEPKAKIKASDIPSKMEEDFSPKKEEKMTGTRAEVARTLFEQAVAGDKSRWRSLWHHQKECKKSWATLGFNPREIERIKLNKPDSI